MKEHDDSQHYNGTLLRNPVSLCISFPFSWGGRYPRLKNPVFPGSNLTSNRWPVSYGIKQPVLGSPAKPKTKYSSAFLHLSLYGIAGNL